MTQTAEAARNRDTNRMVFIALLKRFRVPGICDGRADEWANDPANLLLDFRRRAEYVDWRSTWCFVLHGTEYTRRHAVRERKQLKVNLKHLSRVTRYNADPKLALMLDAARTRYVALKQEIQEVQMEFGSLLRLRRLSKFRAQTCYLAEHGEKLAA